MEAINNFLTSTGFFQFTQGGNWKCIVMILISCLLLFLGIKKKFEPLLLVPIAIGMLVTNLPGSGMFHEILFAGGHVHWDIFQGEPITAGFLSEMFSTGVSADVLQPYVDALWTAAQSIFDADALNPQIFIKTLKLIGRKLIHPETLQNFLIFQIFLLAFCLI